MSLFKPEGLTIMGAVARALASGQVEFRSGVHLPLKLVQHWGIEARDQNGRLLWREEYDNLIPTEGLNYYLNSVFRASAFTSAQFIFLMGTAPTVAAGNTMASHAGWTEITAYSEANRPAWSPAAAASGSISNTGSPVTFTMNAGATVGGAGLCTVNTKGGTTGTFVGGGAFGTGDRVLQNLDTLLVTLSSTLTP